MNLSESVKFVLSKKGHDLFFEFWREDLKKIFTDIKADFKSSPFKTKRDRGIVNGLIDFKDSAFEGLQIVFELPLRIKRGFSHFREDFLYELEGMSDPKEKTVFCLKVLGALTAFVVDIVYGMRRTRKKVNIAALSTRHAFTQFLVSELVLRMSQLFIMRFLLEVEHHLDDPEELNKIKFFKQILLDPTGGIDSEKQQDHGDNAIQIVESLKRYIMTGTKS